MQEQKFYQNKSALNRRIHKIPVQWWKKILEFMQRVRNCGKLPLEYIVDSFPVSVCRNIRIRNCRIYQGKSLEGITSANASGFMA